MKTDAQRQQQLQKIALELNKTGLSYLTHQKFNDAYTYFKQSEKVIESELRIDPTNVQVNKLAGITYNNLACYYKKLNKPKISLIYLQKALEVEVFKVQDWTSTASTHLNICAIQSHLKNHEAAANHAQLSLNMLAKIQNEDKNAQLGKSFHNLCMLSHYNLAVELEHLRRFEEALQQFKNAKQLAKKTGKKNTGIIMACDESIVRITENLKNLKHKLVQLVTKKRKDEEKGFYSYMRKNKKNFRIRQSETSLMAKMKRFKEYEEEQPYHTRTKSFQRLKTQEPQRGNVNTKFSYFPLQN